MLLPASRPPIGSRLALDACLDFDFARMRGQVAGVGVSLESIIVEARSGPALTAGPGGFFRTKAAGVPRFAHRWNGAGRGLQVENAATNLIKYSADLTQTAWTKSTGASASIWNWPIAPDGVSQVCLLNDTQPLSSSPGVASQSVTIANDGYPTVASIYVYPGSQTKIGLTLALSGGTGVTAYGYFDLTEGVCYSISNVASVNIERAAGGYFRLQVAAQNNSSGNTTATLTIGRAGASVSPGYFWIWGAQCEYNVMSASSPIATTNATASRVADLPYYPLGSILAPYQDTIYVEAELQASEGDQPILLLCNNSLTESVNIFRQNSSGSLLGVAVSSNTTQATFTAAGCTAPPGGIIRAAFSFTQNAFQFAARTYTNDYTGAQNAVLTASSGNIAPALFTNAFFGGGPYRNPGGVFISRFVVFPSFLQGNDLSDLIA